MSFIDVLKIAHPDGQMAHEQAKKYAAAAPIDEFTYETGMGRTDDDRAVQQLRKAFPQFNWRLVISHQGERTEWILTIDDNDPREHWLGHDTLPISCPKCDGRDPVHDKQRARLEAARRAAEPKLCTTNGRPVDEVRASQTNETGQHDGYIVLCPDERAKGFVRPYRDSYKHDACGTVTTMGRALSETYARDPKFYDATFCCHCNRHLPVSEFVWTADGERVGS